MAKFEKVYDPEKDEIISRQEAIDSNITEPYFQCPICQTKESTLTIFYRQNVAFFRLLPNGEHTDPDCGYKVDTKELRKRVIQQRDYLNVNEASFVRELKKMVLNQQHKATAYANNNNSGSNQPSSTHSATTSRTINVSHPHRFQLTQRNIEKVRSILETGELEKVQDNKLPIGLYGKAIFKLNSQNKNFHNYDVYDQHQHPLFSLGVSVSQKKLIDEIESHLDQPVEFYGIFNFYTRNGFLDALTFNSDLFFV